MWDIKYRPKKFADVLGQQGNVKLLKARLQRGTAFDTSYLFMGGHGQGKTTLGRIHARAMLCLNLDKDNPEPCNECENCIACLKDQSEAFSERDAASQGKIEHIRALVERIGYAIQNARMRIELFDEAHRIGDGAQDVLLKPIEEKKFIGMFCTTEPNKIKGTIRSRCEEYVIKKVTREDILERAKYVCDQEGTKYEDDALLTIIDCSGGHIRDILNKMEMISQVGEINLANTREYLHLGSVSVYYDILLALNNPTESIALVEKACEEVSPEDIVAGIAEASMNAYRLANKMHTEYMLVERGLAQKVYERYGTGTIHLADYFLKNKYGSRASLLRDVLMLSQFSGNLPPTGPQPTVILGGGPVVQAPQVPVATAPVPPEPVQTAPANPGTPVVEAVPGPAPVPAHANGVSTYVPETKLHDFGPNQWGDRPQPKRSNGIAFGEPDESRAKLDPEPWKRAFARRWLTLAPAKST